MDALSMHRARSWRKAALSLLLAALALASSAAFAQAPSEYDLKAAFVYQFLSYVTWPERKLRADGRLLIGVVGAPELAENLAVLAREQTPAARMIEVRTLMPDGDARDLNVLFVAAEYQDAAAALLQAAALDAVLTITEGDPRPAGSIINFEIIDSKVRFDVALNLARQGGMDISARLLQVALRIVDAP